MTDKRSLSREERFAAERLLERPSADPDDDANVVARAALRLAREDADDGLRAALDTAYEAGGRPEPSPRRRAEHEGHFLRLDADGSLVCHVDGSVLIGDLALRAAPNPTPTDARDGLDG